MPTKDFHNDAFLDGLEARAHAGDIHEPRATNARTMRNIAKEMTTLAGRHEKAIWQDELYKRYILKYGDYLSTTETDLKDGDDDRDYMIYHKSSHGVPSLRRLQASSCSPISRTGFIQLLNDSEHPPKLIVSFRKEQEDPGSINQTEIQKHFPLIAQSGLEILTEDQRREFLDLWVPLPLADIILADFYAEVRPNPKRHEGARSAEPTATREEATALGCAEKAEIGTPRATLDESDDTIIRPQGRPARASREVLSRLIDMDRQRLIDAKNITQASRILATKFKQEHPNDKPLEPDTIRRKLREFELWPL